MDVFKELVDYLGFAIALIVASLFFAMEFPRRKLFFLPPVIAVALIYVFGKFWSVQYELTAVYPLIMSLKYVLYFLIAFLAIYFSFEGGPFMALFCASAGYCLQNIAHNLVTIFALIPVLGSEPVYSIFRLIFYIVVYAENFFTLRRYFRKYPGVLSEAVKQDVMRVVFSVIFVLAATFLTLFSDFILDLNGVYQSLTWLVSGFVLLIDLLIFYIFIIHLLYIKKADDIRNLNLLLSSQKKMYTMNKEVIDAVNIKFHDIKHQLRALNGNISSEQIHEITKGVSLYDRALDTHNEAINTVIAEKGVICNKRGIQFTCMLDGTRFSDFSSADLYAFFGNALDNAIEAVSELPEEKRFISITSSLSKNGKFYNVRIENYCDMDKLHFQDNLPQTGKDTMYHGFGTKSMMLIAHQNNADLFFDHEEDKFVLNLLMKTDSKKEN